MTLRSLALGGAIAFGLATTGFAADTTNTTAAVGTAASKAGTEIEKAVGASDTLSQDDVNSEISLSNVKDAKNTLASAKVDDMTGNIIGPVKMVMTSAAGTPTAIHVDVGGWLGVGEKVVSLNASNFKYIPARNILVTTISKDSVSKMKEIEEKS